MDGGRINAYLDRVMLRRLLTLLAILTGLTAIGAPAHARMAGLDEVQVQARGDGQVLGVARQVSQRAAPEEWLGKRGGQAPAYHRAAISTGIPTVYLRVDRARE